MVPEETEYGRVVEPGAIVEGAEDLGYRPAPDRVRERAERGSTVLVRCTAPDGSGSGSGPEGAGGAHAAEAAEVAVASVYAWLGARVFATAHPEAVRQALALVASVRGRRPPALARRGLA
ncbi:hypothetical protein [Streptomonospora salina]|uniref:Uncharacterized protein n=1 Tax=Streptomonospora salina TaxID=104205 RepID=A0A841EF02_9ACTN|nr:hypothetical protein [Streptomonospora salina]MBB5999478.1 hypothetical protein [Streptomonospora salina]